MGMRKTLVILAAAAVVASCSSSGHEAIPPPTTAVPATTGLAVGHMHISGGPVRRDGTVSDQTLAGDVLVRPVRAHKYTVVSTVKVNASGRFRIALPPGRYFLQGHPSNSGIMAMNSVPFRITAAQTTNVDLVEHAT